MPINNYHNYLISYFDKKYKQEKKIMLNCPVHCISYQLVFA